MGEGHKILVVDDDKSIRTFVSEGLFMEGYEVYTACNGKNGLDQVAQCRPDLIICDVDMPEINGWEFLKCLRSTAYGRSIPVLMMTGYGEMKDMGKAAELGAANYLVKPVQIDQVLGKVAAILNGGAP